MRYTRTLARSCDTFSNHPEEPSDILIKPLIHASELLCRINEHFSYDEVHDSEVRGETMLELTVDTFRSELQRLRETMPESVQEDGRLTHNTLMCGNRSDMKSSLGTSGLRNGRCTHS